MDDAQGAGACPGRGDLGLKCVWRASLLRWVHLPGLVGAEAGVWGWGLQCQPRLLLTTQQWCLASVVSWPSSADFPSCWTPYSCPFRLPSQPAAVPFLGPCSKPHFPVPSLLYTWLRLGKAAVQTVCTVLTLSCLPQMVHRVLLWSSEVPFLSPLISPHEGIFGLQEPLLTFSFPPGLLVPFLILFFFPFFFPTPLGGNFSCYFRC